MRKRISGSDSKNDNKRKDSIPHIKIKYFSMTMSIWCHIHRLLFLYIKILNPLFIYLKIFKFWILEVTTFQHNHNKYLIFKDIFLKKVETNIIKYSVVSTINLYFMEVLKTCFRGLVTVSKQGTDISSK